jgi:hypothetical protein
MQTSCHGLRGFRVTTKNVWLPALLLIAQSAMAQQLPSTSEFAARRLPPAKMAPGDLPRSCVVSPQEAKTRYRFQFSEPQTEAHWHYDGMLSWTLQAWAKQQFGYVDTKCLDAGFTVRKFQEAIGTAATGILTEADLNRIEAAMDVGRNAQARATPDAPESDAGGGTAFTVFGIPLGRPLRMPLCPMPKQTGLVRPAFAPSTCHTRFGPGDMTDPTVTLSYQVYLSQPDHPTWLGHVGQSQVIYLPSPSLLLSVRDSAVGSVRFETDQTSREIAFEALTAKFGAPVSMAKDHYDGRWIGPGVTAVASCNRRPPPRVDLYEANGTVVAVPAPTGIFIPICKYVIQLDAEAAYQEQQRSQQQEIRRQKSLESGHKL